MNPLKSEIVWVVLYNHLGWNEDWRRELYSTQNYETKEKAEVAMQDAINNNSRIKYEFEVRPVYLTYRNLYPEELKKFNSNQ